MNNPLVTRLLAALNRHDVDAVVACFGDDISSEWPAHPARSFQGRDQVRRNWQAIFDRFPQITVSVTSSVEAGDEVWGEWRYVRAEGDELRGVIIITVRDDLIRRSRFYMEEVDATAAPRPGGPQRMTG
ncbi:MAG: nuclear transport factor 2 family protein [Streptosporangiales bacterium]|nr:nuclear transport factor 2 family protein [Streptosporangiales bacterium]